MHLTVLVYLGLTIVFTEQADAQSQEELVTELIDRVRPLTQVILTKNSLKYGDSCSWETEQNRTRILKHMLRLADSFDARTYGDQMWADLYDMSQLPGNVCNAYKGFQCRSPPPPLVTTSAEPSLPGGVGKCYCGQFGEASGIKLDLKMEKGACVIDDGTICAPHELLNPKNPLLDPVPGMDYACAGRTSCRLKGNGTTCTVASMKAAVELSLKNEGLTLNPQNTARLIVGKVNEGICVCKGYSMPVSSVLMLGMSILATVIYAF